MSVKYYNDPNKYPPTVLNILGAAREHTIKLLYSNEYDINPQTARDRFILSDIGAGVDISVGDAVERFKQINFNFPFTAYNIGEPELSDERRNAAVLYDGIYCDKIGSYLSVFPMELEIQMVSFFTRADDYFVARKLLHRDTARLTKLQVPFTINNIPFNLIVLVKQLVSKGTYPAEFEQYLAQGKIWDVVHSWNVIYMDFALSDKEVNEIDEIIIGPALPDPSNPDFLPITSDSLTITLPNKVEVVSVNPNDEETNIAINSSISVTFNNPMIPHLTQDAFGILPFIEGGFSWNVDDTVLTYTPYNDLNNDITYNITVLKTASDVNSRLEEDFESTFKTIA